MKRLFVSTTNTCEAYSGITYFLHISRAYKAIASPFFNHAFLRGVHEVPTVGHFSFINYLFRDGREKKVCSERLY